MVDRLYRRTCTGSIARNAIAEGFYITQIPIVQEIDIRYTNLWQVGCHGGFSSHLCHASCIAGIILLWKNFSSPVNFEAALERSQFIICMITEACAYVDIRVILI